MIGLMLAGVELALRALDRAPRPASGPARPAVPDAARRRRAGRVGEAARAPGAGLRRDGRRARRRGGRLRDVAAGRGGARPRSRSRCSSRSALGTGLGFGWTRTLGTANVIRSWMSLATDLGQLSGQVGILAGLGDHTDTVLTITRGLGGIVGGAAVPAAAAAVLRGRMDPVTGLGVGLGAVVLLGPGRAPLVPAVGGDPAGRHPRDAAAPPRRTGGVGAARGHAAARRAPTSRSGPSSCRWRSSPGSSSSSVALLVVRRELLRAVRPRARRLLDAALEAALGGGAPRRAGALPHDRGSPAGTASRARVRRPDSRRRCAASARGPDLVERLDFR